VLCFWAQQKAGNRLGYCYSVRAALFKLEIEIPLMVGCESVSV
jgi:hypothetical protein